MKYIIIIFLTLILISVYLVSDSENNKHQNIVTKINNKFQDINNKNDIVGKTSVSKPETKNINQSQLDEISDFNRYIRNEVVSSFGYKKGWTVLDEMLQSTSPVDADESVIEGAIKKINNIQDNPESQSLIIRELYSYCEALEYHLKKSNNKLETLNINKIKAKNFLIALNRSRFCETLGTEKDPFFIILKLARSGDRIAQLFLIEDFHQAIKRGLLNPLQYPIEYSNIRDEIVTYLEQLSVKGVKQATLYLIYLYDNGNGKTKFAQYLPEDTVLKYFYLVRYEKQFADRDMDLPWVGSFASLKSPFEIYQTLSDKQKARADRMLERAGY